MDQEKPRIEPEVNMSPEAGAEDSEPINKVTLSDLSVEDLVPGLEEEIAKMQDEDPFAERIAQLEAERDEFKDKWTRALAEAENVRRRATRDRADGETYGGTRLARDLLSVYDNLERALEAADDGLRDSAGAFIEGIELTQRELINAFEKHKIQKVTPEIGEKFDPNRHQAMFEAPIPGAEPEYDHRNDAGRVRHRRPAVARGDGRRREGHARSTPRGVRVQGSGHRSGLRFRPSGLDQLRSTRHLPVLGQNPQPPRDLGISFGQRPEVTAEYVLVPAFPRS